MNVDISGRGSFLVLIYFFYALWHVKLTKENQTEPFPGNSIILGNNLNKDHSSGNNVNRQYSFASPQEEIQQSLV